MTLPIYGAAVLPVAPAAVVCNIRLATRTASLSMEWIAAKLLLVRISLFNDFESMVR